MISVLILAAAGTAHADGLAGRIWKPAAERFVEAREVIAAARGARFVLLGETHTIARHHTLQARLVRAIAGDGRQPPVILEMVGRDRQADIDAWRRASPPDAATFGDAVDWRERGWPPWSEYQPIVDAALAHDLGLRGGGPPSPLLRRVAREGLAAVDDHAGPALPGLDAPLGPTAEGRLRTTLERAHCGLAEHAPIDRMIGIQRLRDASMAQTMMSADKGDGAILIAGHGHVRADYGVPEYLRRGTGERDFMAIALIGVAGRPTLAEQREAAGGALPFDYVWFTQGGTSAPDCSTGGSR